MLRSAVLVLASWVILAVVGSQAMAQERAYSQQWGGVASAVDYERFYHYPYIYYPQNYWAPSYFRSADHLYWRYPPEMRIPIYNRQWMNYYPEARRFHRGHHFILDTF